MNVIQQTRVISSGSILLFDLTLDTYQGVPPHGDQRQKLKGSNALYGFALRSFLLIQSSVGGSFNLRLTPVRPDPLNSFHTLYYTYSPLNRASLAMRYLFRDFPVGVADECVVSENQIEVRRRRPIQVRFLAYSDP